MANNMSHKLSHTMLRGRTYYTNFRLNDSTSFVRLSLGTDSRKQAEVIMNQIRPFIPLVQNGTMSLDEFRRRMQGYRTATKLDFDNYLLHTLQMDITEVKRLPQLGHYHKRIFPDSPLSPSATVESAQKYADLFLERLYSGDDIGAKEVLMGLQSLDMLEQKKGGLSTSKLEFSRDAIPWAKEVAGEIDMNRAIVYQAYSAFYSGDLTQYRQILETLQSQLKTREHTAKSTTTSIQPIAATAKNEQKKETISLSQAWMLYVKEKGQKWRISVANENQRFYDVLYYVVGNKSIDSVTKQDIREALKITENLPNRTKLPYKRLTLKECIAYDVPEEELLSSQHVEKHLKIWRSLFRKYLVETKDFLEKSPTDGISYQVSPNRRGHYNAAELVKLKTKLFSLSDTDWRKWYFLALMYTGARRGELASIKKQDIRKDDETGRWYIFIEEGKTDHAQRQIPLHKKLENGLLTLINGLNDNDFVFNGLPNYTTTTEVWANLMKELSIPDYDDYGLKRRIHSLRHTFMTNCIAAKQPIPLMQFVVGHSRNKSLGVTALYTHRPPLKDLLCIVDFQQ
ncbi:DUF3258 domain-containing protein [Citrobacter youngae]|nr:DUF3258 domain-containing protein [Citrobacter youngae]